MIRRIGFWILVGVLGAASQEEQKISTDLACYVCHQSSDWQVDAGLNFDHSSTGYILEGLHAELVCNQCHPGSTPLEKHNFSNISNECNACHNDIHQDQWGQDCQQCHTPQSWTLAQELQNHDLTRFALQGPHRALSCESCHVSNPSRNPTLPIDCWGCHEPEYTRTTNPDHFTIDLDKDCEICHEASNPNWQTSTFNHTDTGFILEGRHAESDCGSCHSDNSPPSRSCSTCHVDDYTNSIEPAHAEQGYPMNCNQCHDPFTWNSHFTHDITGFELRGEHELINCSDCHANQIVFDAPTECSACHLDVWESSTIPPHMDAEFEKSCEDCHDESAWVPSFWDHDIESDYPLDGAHLEVSCEGCHISVPYDEQTTDCYSCHVDDYEATLEPNHITSGLPTTCEICHVTVDWNSQGIDHDQTQFPLVGAHVNLACETCHADGYDLPIDCEGCHITDYFATATGSAPDHQQYGFDHNCLECHDQSVWRPSYFDHDTQITGYEIQGAHLNLLPNDCFTCHEDDQWTGISQSCEDCHQSTFIDTENPDHQLNGFPDNLCETCHSQNTWTPDIFDHVNVDENCVTCHMIPYSNAVNPNHSDAEFDTQCEECHTTSAWSPGRWIHGEQTDFSIQGAHLNLVCGDCHTGTPYSSLVNECGTCHESNFNETTDPDHLSSGIPIELCENCHSQTVWQPAEFDHNTSPESCITCHLVQYNAATNPPHDAAEFGSQCEECHTTTDWQSSTWLHGEQTEFNIQGAHLPLACNVCHTTTPYSGLVNECGTCHQSKFDQTTDPDHSDSGFPVNLCESCHSQTTWQPTIFDHASNQDNCANCHQTQYNSTTDPSHTALVFPITCETCHTTDQWAPSTYVHDVATTGFLVDGAHESQSCNQCHEDWEPPTEIRSCASSSCHADNYQATLNPPHETMAFSQDCEACHSTNTWTPSQFEHNQDNTGFILEGAHLDTDCQQCHGVWEILPTPRSCSAASCHLADYQGTTDPDHESAAFPLDCESCHSVIAWEPSTFNHDGQYFPINSGEHREVWNDCSQCHVNANDFAEFTCFGAGCHNITDTNNEHCEGSNCESCNGFTYPSSGVDSNDCLTCHPTGDTDDCGDDDFLKFRPRSYPKTNDAHETK